MQMFQFIMLFLISSRTGLHALVLRKHSSCLVLSVITPVSLSVPQ